jgi:hypothetical protein
MDEQTNGHEQQSTSILELLYLIRAKNKGEMSFAEWLPSALSWAKAVIAEYEMGQQQSAPSKSPIQEDECPSGL